MKNISICMKMILLLFVFVPIASSSQFYSDVDNFKRNSVYLEFLGNGGASFTINYERILINGNDKFAVRSGFGYFPESYYYTIAVPLEFIVIFGSKLHHIELGGGITYYATIDNEIDPHDNQRDVFTSILVIPRLGYRFTGKKGLLIRIGYTPVLQLPYLSEFDQPFQLFGGLSLGYSF